MWNLGRPDPLCGALEPEALRGTWNLLRVEPSCGTREFGARFPAAAPNHPEALLEEPQAFRSLLEKKKRFKQHPRFKKFPHPSHPHALFPSQGRTFCAMELMLQKLVSSIQRITCKKPTWAAAES